MENIKKMAGSTARTTRGWATYIVSAAGVVICVGVCILFLATRAPAPADVNLGTSLDLQRLQTDLRAATNNEPNAAGRTLAIDEPELNSYIRSRLAASQVGHDQSANQLKDLRVQLEDDAIIFYLVINSGSRETMLRVAGRMHSSGEYVEFTPISAAVGSLPIPAAVLRAAMDRLNSSHDLRDNMRLPPGVCGVEVRDGKIILNFDRNPPKPTS